MTNPQDIATHVPARELKAPFPYFGGKSKIAQQVWGRLGNPDVYVEPFAGSMAVLLARPTNHAWWQRKETVNDASGHIVNFYRAVTASPKDVALFANWPVSELDLTARHLVLTERQQALAQRLSEDPAYFDAEMAGWWVWGISSWVGGEWCSGLGPWRRGADAPGVYRKMPMAAAAHSGKGVHRALSGTPEKWLFESVPDLDHQVLTRMVEEFEAIAQRLRRVRILCGDWKRVTKSVVGPTRSGVTGVFLDPPYALSERRANLYGPADRSKAKGSAKETPQARDIHEESREWALLIGSNPQFRVAYCSYKLEEETALFESAGWRSLDWTAAGGYGLQAANRARSNREREVIWFSPHCLSDKDVMDDCVGQANATGTRSEHE